MTKFASTRGAETGLTAVAAAGSSTFREDGTGFDVPAGGTSFSNGALQTPKDDDSGDEEADDEEPPFDEITIITALKGRAGDERGTLRAQRLWMNIFFTILAMAKLKR
jgi:hypothetical protein